MNLKRHTVLFCCLLLGFINSVAAQATFSEVFGTGQDGNLNVSGTVTLDLFLSTLETGLNAGATSFTPSDFNAIASVLQIGDELLIIDETGVDAGAFEFVRIASFNAGAGTIGLEAAIQNNFDSSNAVYHVPNYTTVSVPAGQTLMIGASGAGSTLAFRASDSVAVGGTVSVAARGFNGGGGGFAGSSYTGPGGFTLSANAGGGGGGNQDTIPTGGGGGGYGVAGQDGPSQSNSGFQTLGGEGGFTYGAANLSDLLPGSGGGSGESGGVLGGSQTSLGGRGGGIVFICTPELTITGTIDARGQAGQGGFASVFAGSFAGAGGGSGGAIWLQAREYFGTGTVTAAGGPGGPGGFSGAASSGPGGNGGAGRVRIDTTDGMTVNSFDVISGSTFNGEFDAPPPPNAVGNWAMYQ